MWWNGENGIFGPNCSCVLRVGELEERERPAVAETEEAVAVGALGPEQHVLLAPGREQRQADHVLVELACRLQVARHVRVVVQPCSGDFALLAMSGLRSERIVELDAVADRQRLEQEAARREFLIVFLVGQVLRPTASRSSVRR